MIGAESIHKAHDSGWSWESDAAGHARVVIAAIAAPALGVVADWLAGAGYAVRFERGSEAVTEAAAEAELVIVEIDLPSGSNLHLLESIRGGYPDVPLLAIVAEKGETEACVSAMRRGATDFIEGPPECLRVLTSVENCIARGRMGRRLVQLEHAAGDDPEEPVTGNASAAIPPIATRRDGGRAKTLQEIEKDAIVDTLRAAKGNISAAVRQLRIGRSTLYRKLKQFGIAPDACRG